MSDPVDLLDGVIAQAASIRAAGGWAAEVADRRAAVVTSREVFGAPDDLIAVLPEISFGRSLRRPGRWVVDGESGGDCVVGFDAAGRAVIAERPGYVLATWRHAGAWTEWCTFSGGEPHVVWSNDDGAAGDEQGRWVERWHRQDGIVVRVERASGEPGGWVTAMAREADLDADGRVVRMRGDDEPREEFDEASRLGDEQWRPALLAALERAAMFACPRVVLDYRVRGLSPLREQTTGMAIELAVALADAAAAAAVAVGGPESPFCVEVARPGDAERGRRTLPPIVRLAGEAWRVGMVEKSSHDGEAITSLWRGEKAGDVVRLELADHLDEAALLACRELSTTTTQAAAPGDQVRGAAILDELADALARELADPSRFPGATPEFVALVDTLAGFEKGDPLERASRVFGSGRVHAFRATIASQARTRRGVVTALRDARSLTQQALTSRTALAELARLCGLDAEAARLAHDVAQVGLLARAPRNDERPASRLGGHGLLPHNTPTPTAADGRPLSFLAGVDLAELPPTQDRLARPPAAGWWLFYLDIGEQDGEPFFEEELNVEGGRARLLVAAAGVATTISKGSAPMAFPARPVVFTPVLTLPEGADTAEALGLNVYAATAYDELEERLRCAQESIATEGGRLATRHWLGGSATGVQGGYTDQSSVLLLHLEDDPAIGFAYLDAGAVQFRIDASALAAAEWTAATAAGDSH